MQPSLAEVYEETLTQKLELVLNKAGCDGALTWVEVNQAMTILERYEVLADERRWTIYEAFRKGLADLSHAG